MSASKQLVSVGERRLKLSNLEKELYPADHISKAEIVKYYLHIAPMMLHHIKGRPLSLIRYPDGINEEHFFQKQMPDWAPQWIDSVLLGEDETNDYVLAEEKATLIWLANLASLEIHQMSSRKPHFNQPDYMAFDLDPPDNSNFKQVIDIAFSLKKHVESYGYHPFVKTSGKKGLHLALPLKRKTNMDAVFEASKKLAQDFVEQHPDETTLRIKKKARKGRMLIDIYRNRPHQTMISPYSLRAVAGAPVSMPLSWDEVSNVHDAGAYHINNAPDKIDAEGDVWKEMDEYAVQLHTHRSENEPVTNDPPESAHHKSPEQLEEYSSKRDFDKTFEPNAEVPEDEGHRFVIQRHNASSLHYDLRLEQEGVLRSWTVPKGLPPRPGVKRLAVETEDHPLDYLTFEGEIPEDEYGGGQVWVYALGTYDMTSQKKGSLHFRLESPAVSGAYHMYQTEGDHWLIEKDKEPGIDWLKERIKPMNGKRVSEPPEGNYSYEVKWDGIRALISLEDDHLMLYSRNGNDITDKFPELQKPDDLHATCGLFDGEIVHLDEEGKPKFQKVIHRLKRSSKATIAKLSQKKPVYCYLFDCLYLDGRPLVEESLNRRYAWLEDVVRKEKGSLYRLSEMMENGKALFEETRKQNMEGIMAKKRDSSYQVGKRSDDWLKVKAEDSVDCLVIGYTQGSGSRSPYFGALHLAERKNDELKYRGKVGTGFNEQSLKEITDKLDGLNKTHKPIEEKIDQPKDTTWVEPELVLEITYDSLTEGGAFRAAVFKRLRPDLYQ